MNRISKAAVLGLAALTLSACAARTETAGRGEQTKGDQSMSLGNFSISLTVKNIEASRAFYEKLGFKVVGGNAKQNWLIMQNDAASIGLFQGMFDKNTLTFNPGWNRDKQTLAQFEDVREIQRTLHSRGITPVVAADESTSGPAHMMILDPDGNPILIDQHVPRPKK